MSQCTECNSEYNPEDVSLPSPLPDGMCGVCGTQLTEEQINDLISSRLSINNQ